MYMSIVMLVLSSTAKLLGCQCMVLCMLIFMSNATLKHCLRS